MNGIESSSVSGTGSTGLRRALTRSILYPLNLRHKGISELDIRRFGDLDRMTPEAVREIQARNLRDFLRYAGRHCTYYRAAFEEHGVRPDAEDPFSEVAKLPPLTKPEIRDHLEELISDEFADRKALVKKATGGSTGVPLLVYGDREDYRQNGLTIARQRRWIGWEGGMEVVSLFGGFRDVPGRLNRLLKSLLINDTIINVMDTTRVDYEAILARLRRRTPEVLIGYFSILKEVARVAAAEGAPLDGLKLAVACAEPLEERGRREAEQWLGARVYAQYGCRELGTFAQECSEQRGYHYAQDQVLCETLDDAGRPADYGHLTITYMGNRVTPLIRYQIGDGSAIDCSPCPCGLPYHRLSVIDGRLSAMIRLPGGGQVTSMIFPHLLKDYPWIIEYQAEQVALDHLKLRVKTRRELLSAGGVEYATDKLLRLLGRDLRLEWLLDDPFLPVPTGKHVYFLSRL